MKYMNKISVYIDQSTIIWNFTNHDVYRIMFSKLLTSSPDWNFNIA